MSALVLGAGCLDERALLPSADATVRMALRVELRVGSVGERVVEIRARYRRANGEQPTLLVRPAQVTVSDGVTVQQAVIIDIGPCTSDGTRVGGEGEQQGCLFAIELTLKNGAGEILGSAVQDVGPVGPGPAGSPTFVLTTPTLTVAPTNLAFTARVQQSVPPAQPVTVAADNTDAALGTLATSIAYTSGQNWLRATIDQGSHTISVQPTTTTVSAGTYAAVVTVTSSVDGMKPRTLPVTYQVSPPPVLTVTGGGDGTGSVTSSPSGISCTITRAVTSGTCSAPFVPNAAVTLSATPSGSATFAGWGGSCSGTGPCALTLAQSMSVSATFVAPTPILQLSPSSLAFAGVSRGASPPRQSVAVVNAGGGTLVGIGLTRISYGGSEPPWLDVTVSGTTLSVGATPTNLSPGTYTASAVIGSANGGSATLGVTFTVAAPPPALAITPNALSFSAIIGGPGPGTKTARASNVGSGTFADLGRLSVGSNTTSWLRVAIDGDIIAVTPDVSNLPRGTHNGVVIITSTNGGSATISVTLTVGVIG